MTKKILDLYKKYEEIINYIIVGGMTTIISILSYYLIRIILSAKYLLYFLGFLQLHLHILQIEFLFLSLIILKVKNQLNLLHQELCLY